VLDSDGAVAVVGVAANVPGARDVEEYWLNLVRGREPVPIALDPGSPGAEYFDAEFFGLTPRQAQACDPRIRLFLEIAHSAIENAGYDPATLRRVGVFASAGPAHGVQRHLAAGGPGLRGLGVTVLTACASALVGLHRAWQYLRAGDCDVAVVGGTDLAPPHGHGACAVLVKRLADALVDRDHISAVIRGIAVDSDKVGAGAIVRAMTLAGLRPEDISYIETAADQFEAAALADAYRQLAGAAPSARWRIGSMVGNLGQPRPGRRDGRIREDGAVAGP
jgi:acyl transferase domain-containing protein